MRRRVDIGDRRYVLVTRDPDADRLPRDAALAVVARLAREDLRWLVAMLRVDGESPRRFGPLALRDEAQRLLARGAFWVEPAPRRAVDNPAPEDLEELPLLHDGTRIAAQEDDGEVVSDIEGDIDGDFIDVEIDAEMDAPWIEGELSGELNDDGTEAEMDAVWADGEIDGEIDEGDADGEIDGEIEDEDVDGEVDGELDDEDIDGEIDGEMPLDADGEAAA